MMRRIGRYILNGVTGLSLLLCAATAFLCVRSYWATDGLSHVDVELGGVVSRTTILLSDGIAWVERVRFGPKWQGLPTPGWSYVSATTPLPKAYNYGVGGISDAVSGDHGTHPVNAKTIIIAQSPIWHLAWPTLVLPVARCWLWLRGRRRSRLAAAFGRCPACHYDLRATPARCPECGAVPRPSPTPIAETPTPRC